MARTEILKIKGDWEEVVNDCRATVKKPPLGRKNTTAQKPRRMCPLTSSVMQTYRISSTLGESVFAVRPPQRQGHMLRTSRKLCGRKSQK